MFLRVFYFVLLFTTFFYGQHTRLDSLFNTANEHHRKAHYQKALDDYQQILNSGFISSALHYNIANTHYAMKAIAPSIYHYKKALQINPENKDARYNLSFAQKAILDDIKIVPQTFLQRIKNTYIFSYHYDTWAVVAVVFLFVTLLSFVFFYIAQKELTRRLFFMGFMFFAIVFIVGIIATISTYNHTKNYKEAVIFEKELPVKKAPYASSELLFMLHEGTSVVILDTVASWYKVRIADGNIGWLAKSGVKEL